jgi:transcriptional regulator with XRE-family HTH domain
MTTSSTKPIPLGALEAGLGARFREKRRAAGVWLVPLAQHLDVSVNTIRWHEAGARMMRADMLVKAAHFMKIEPRELLPEAGEAPAPAGIFTATEGT